LKTLLVAEPTRLSEPGLIRLADAKSRILIAPSSLSGRILNWFASEASGANLNSRLRDPQT
jgi:hypothetical protein